jgi:hypothetical protein
MQGPDGYEAVIQQPAFRQHPGRHNHPPRCLGTEVVVATEGANWNTAATQKAAASTPEAAMLNGTVLKSAPNRGCIGEEAVPCIMARLWAAEPEDGRPRVCYYGDSLRSRNEKVRTCFSCPCSTCALLYRSGPFSTWGGGAGKEERCTSQYGRVRSRS